MKTIQKHGWVVTLLLICLGIAVWTAPGPVGNALFDALGKFGHFLVVLVDKITQALPHSSAGGQ